MKKKILLLILCLCILSANTMGHFTEDFVISPQEHIIRDPIKK